MTRRSLYARCCVYGDEQKDFIKCEVMNVCGWSDGGNASEIYVNDAAEINVRHERDCSIWLPRDCLPSRCF